MSLSQFTFLGKSVMDMQSWFVDIFNHLSAKNYDNGTWEPIITGITPDGISSPLPDITAWYQRFGIECYFTIIIDGTHSISFGEITLPLIPKGYGVAIIHSLTDNSNLGSAKVDTTTGNLHIREYFVESEVVIIRGFYKVEGI
jgi:hypothetical protein